MMKEMAEKEEDEVVVEMAADNVATTTTTTTEKSYAYKEDTSLTVLKTSLFFVGDGFTVYDANGDLLFRVDSYDLDVRGRSELVLMDATGQCLLTVHRKRPSLHQRWEGFLGDGIGGKKPVFSVRRSSIIGHSSVRVEMYNNSNDEYHVEGSFANRSCTVFNAKKEPVAEVKRKVDTFSGVLLGKDVFSLCLKPGFDAALAMGVVLVLDQINGDDYFDDDEGGATVVPTTDSSHGVSNGSCCMIKDPR